MKSNIHPKWHDDCQVTCSCGHSFTTGSTKDKIHVDICSQCHPFFTGEMKFVDVQGRVEKFQAKQKKGASFQAIQKKKKDKKVAREKEPVKSLKEMLKDIRVDDDSKETPKKTPKK